VTQGLTPVESGHLPARLKSLRKKSDAVKENVPQGLKPNLFAGIYGSAEAEPFQDGAFFRRL
jgi:hypothetical protein